MKLNFFTSVALGTLALTLISVVIEMAFGGSFSGGYFSWFLFSCALVISIIGVIIRNSSLTGKKLSLLVFLIYFLIGHFNLLIEAYLFEVTNAADTVLITLQGLLITLIASPLLVFIFRKWIGDDEKLVFKSRTKAAWTWRIVLGDLLYVFFYLLAGMILYAVYPQLMDFYDQKIPPFSLMINTQFFRALVFIAVAILICRTTTLPLIQRALIIGIFFAIVGGLAPLIVPDNEHMPDYVLVVGDVNNTIACGLVAVKLGIRLAHVEAGLRSGDRGMPEEINRLLTD